MRKTHKKRLGTVQHWLVWTNKDGNPFTSACHSLTACTMCQDPHTRPFFLAGYGAMDSTDAVGKSATPYQMKT